MFRSSKSMLSATKMIVSRSFGGGRTNNSQKMAYAAAGVAIPLAFFSYNMQGDATKCDPNFTLLKNEILQMIDAEEERREDGTSIAGTLIRLAWHSSGTYSALDNTGGSNGSTQRMNPEAGWGANAGLDEARKFLNPLKVKYNMSYADLWTFAGAVAVQSLGGPKIAWRSGRTDSATPTTVPDGRLPDADKGCPVATTGHIRDIFGRMGFTDREIVALSGAHSIGRCHTDASGYWGPWTYAETTFSNEYFRLLLEEKWTLKRTHEGKPWTGPAQFESPDGKIMMLPSDMALVQDAEFRKYVEMYTKDQELFFKDFSAAFSKLMELGVKFPWNSTRVN